MPASPDVRGARPIDWIVFLTELVLDSGRIEHRINGSGVCLIGTARIVDDALELFGVRQPLIRMPRQLKILGELQRIFPVHASATVGLHPDQPRGMVSDGTVAIVFKLIVPVRAVPANVEHVKGLLVAVAHHPGGIALDAAISEVHTKHGGIAAHGRAAIFCAGGELGIDDSLSL